MFIIDFNSDKPLLVQMVRPLIKRRLSLPLSRGPFVDVGEAVVLNAPFGTHKKIVVFSGRTTPSPPPRT